MLIYCFTPADFRNNSHLFKAMIALCLGLLLMFVRSFFVSAFALVILVSGVKTALSARVYKAVGDKKWYMELLAGFALAVLAPLVIVISNLNIVRKVAFVLLGVTLIAQGAINLAFMFWLRADKEEQVETQQEQSEPIEIEAQEAEETKETEE